MTANNNFLKATPLYKEYAILELLSKDSNISQRAIAKQLDSSLSMINQYLEDYQSRGLIDRDNINGRDVEYSLTKKGLKRLKLLNVNFLKSVSDIYLLAKRNIIEFLDKVTIKKYKRILLYGAGEVADLFLKVLIEDNDSNIQILAIVDDDILKQGKEMMGVEIIPFEKIVDYDFDGIFVSNYTHAEKIINKLITSNISTDSIITFFD